MNSGIKLMTMAALLASGLVAPVSADIYKWKDANGKVHFSDKPPPDQAADKVEPVSTLAGRPVDGANTSAKTANDVAPAAGGKASLGQRCQQAARNLRAASPEFRRLLEQAKAAGKPVEVSKQMADLTRMGDLLASPQCEKDVNSDPRKMQILDCLSDNKEAIGISFCMAMTGR